MVLSGENKVLNVHQNIRNNSPVAIQNYGFAREFSEQYNYALRITHYALKSPDEVHFLVYNGIKAMNIIDRKA